MNVLYSSEWHFFFVRNSPILMKNTSSCLQLHALILFTVNVFFFRYMYNKRCEWHIFAVIFGKFLFLFLKKGQILK